MEFRSLRGNDSQGIYVLVQMLLVFAGLKFASLAVWRGLCLAIAALALLGWLAAQRRARAVSDTPTSRIESAAQGYVELHGRGRPLSGLPVVAPLSHSQCLWYRYQVECRRNDRWELEDSGVSDDSFLLDDGTGIAVVSPEGAEVLPAQQRNWTEGNRRYSEWLLLEGESIYVLGGFTTRDGSAASLHQAEDLRQLIAEWKLDQPRLLKRFDLNGDGQLDLREWELVRAQARREVEQSEAVLRAQPGVNLVGVPSGGRPYLISSLPAAKIVGRFRLWIGVHLLIFAAALGGFAKACALF